MKFAQNLAILILPGSSSLAQDGVKRTREELHRLHQDSKAYIPFLPYQYFLVFTAKQ